MPAAALSVPLRALPLVALNSLLHKCVYFGHFNLTFQCTIMCTSAVKG
jgi:hypothetical protein